MAIGLNTAQIIDRARDRGVNLSESAAQSILDQAYDPSQYGADPGSVDSLLSSYSGGSGSNISSPDEIIRQAMESAKSFFNPFEEAANRSKEFEERNPFIFDEALARSSAEERLDPYFKAELRDYLTGVNRKRERTLQDERQIRQELTTQTEEFIGDTKQQIEDAVSSSQEGFAGAGLFFSGGRTRAEGRIGVQGEETLGRGVRRLDLQQDQSQLRQARTLEDLESAEQRQRRLFGAQRETDLSTDVLGQKREQAQQYELERQQYVGSPLTTGTSSLSLLL